MDRLEGLKLGNYHILEQIGQGGMTTVFKSLDTVRNETVAVKVLSPFIAQDPKFETRFNREIDLLLELKHANIVPILDYGKHNGLAYIVMPFMPRGTLYDRLNGGPLSPQEGIQIVDDVAAGLQYAHDHGIVHRDVKPSNILLADDGHALLSDFGFAHELDLSLSLTGSAVIGTPSYMSPEHCQGGGLTPRSDQYSLGVILYQICTGRLPFSGDTPMAIAVQHINQPLPRPRAINARIPRQVEDVLTKALNKRPEDRFDSVSELSRAFHEVVTASLDEAGNFIPQPDRFDISTWILERSPVSGPLASLRRLWHWRYRTAALATLMLVLLPSAGFALAAFQPTTGAADTALAPSTTPIDFEATIGALNTEVSSGSGSGLGAEAVATIVEATMQAMSLAGLNQPAGPSRPTGSPTASPTATGGAPGGPVVLGGSPTSSPTSGGGDGGGGNGNQQPAPTATRTPSPTSSGGTAAPTSGPTATGASQPTASPVPQATNTPLPQATNTPAPNPTNTSAPPPTSPPPTSPPPTSASDQCYDGEHGNKHWPTCTP